MLGITTKLEIHVDSSDIMHPDKVMDFAKRWKCSAVIVAPDQFPTYFVSKIARNADVMLGVMIDFPHGKRKGTRKFHDVPNDVAEADIFEVMLEDGLSASTYKKEVAAISDIIKKTMNPTAQVRIVLGSHHRKTESINGAIQAARAAGCPMVRTNPFVLGTKGLDHGAEIITIKEQSSIPIKVSGEVDIGVIKDVGHMIGNKGRFAVDFEQANKIVNALKADDRLAREMQDLLVIENVEDIKDASEEELHKIMDEYSEQFAEALGVETAELALMSENGRFFIKVSVLPGQQEAIDVEEVPFLIDDEVVKVPITVVTDNKLSI